MKPQLSESLFSKHKHRQVSDVPLISWFNTSYLYSLHVSAFWQFVYTRFSTELYAWRSHYTTMVIADRLLNSPFFTLTQSEHSLSKLYPKTCLSVSSLIESVEGACQQSQPRCNNLVYCLFGIMPCQHQPIKSSLEQFCHCTKCLTSQR